MCENNRFLLRRKFDKFRIGPPDESFASNVENFVTLLAQMRDDVYVNVLIGEKAELAESQPRISAVMTTSFWSARAAYRNASSRSSAVSCG